MATTLLTSFRLGVRTRFQFPGVGAARSISCHCRAVMPTDAKIATLVEQRRLGELYHEVPCERFKEADFKELSRCVLTSSLRDFVFHSLHNSPDVIHIKDWRVHLEALKPAPKGDLGNLTGDYGKHLSKFVKKCHQKGYLSDVGSLVDVGGQNTSTVKRITKVLGHKLLPSLIVDINAIVPHLLPKQDHIKFAIDDAMDFLASDRFTACVQDMRDNGSPNLIIFNNLLNVLRPEKAWAILDAAWEQMLPGDYLVISGLVAAHLAGAYKGVHTLDGITEFHSVVDGSFYKTGLRPDFPQYIEWTLENATVLVQEPINYFTEGRRGKTFPVKSQGVLALRKTT